jgi:flagellar basal body rod protein FlgC
MKEKVIFESEEECAEFLCNVYNHNKEYCLRSLVPMAKQKGYIRKSAVEEAEEMYSKWMQTEKYDGSIIAIIHKQHEAIQELKSEIERLKK